MTVSTNNSRTGVRTAALWSAFFAVIWVAVAILRPGMTFHLAPFLVAAAPPILFAMESGSRDDRNRLPAIGAIGAAVTVGTALFVSAIGAMEGPAFELFSTPMVEVLVFTAVGTVIVLGIGWVRLSR